MKIRSLKTEDKDEILPILAQLTEENYEYSDNLWNEIVSKILSTDDHKIFVAVENNKIVGTATAIIQQKIIRNFGTVGLIDDVAVHPEYQGKGIGTSLVKWCLGFFKQKNCYKVEVWCEEYLTSFYKDAGFSNHYAIPLIVNNS